MPAFVLNIVLVFRWESRELGDGIRHKKAIGDEQEPEGLENSGGLCCFDRKKRLGLFILTAADCKSVTTN
jgi:hypothetical protein